MNRVILYIMVGFFCHQSVFAQEVLTGLQENAVIKSQSNQLFKSTPQTLTLPFLDDFSEGNIYPNNHRWTDNKVFLNTDYPVFPPTIGVATFDAIDENGSLYEAANTTKFIADYLTSQSIRLDSVFLPEPKALTPADSVYFSFYFQPEGYGFAPDPGDSLVLEFYRDHPVDSLKQWVWIWSSPGMSLNEFFALHNNYFRQVMIPVTDTAFFKSGFRFRFYNYASILYPTVPSRQSNRDHWHLDYVFLDQNRNASAQHHKDIAFVTQPKSFLKNYYHMPYRQYKQNFINEMLDTLRVLATNLNDSPTQASYRYSVKNADDSHIKTYETGIYTFPPYSQSGFVTQQQIARPPVNFVFPTTTQPWAVFKIEHVLTSHDNFTAGHNDTTIFYQPFWDYYSYDDGTAEAGYGLNFAGGKVAYRFKLNTPDTLNAIQMFFNRTLGNANQKYFHLKVWNETGGIPGDVQYIQEFLQPIYSSSINKLHKYELSNPLFISNSNFPGLVFYIGWEQTTSDMLNVGFDRNNNNKQNTFYNTGGVWYNSMLDGSIMMRPVTGVNGPSAIENPQEDSKMKVFPNPVAGNTLYLDSGELPLVSSQIKIFNMMGNPIIDQAASNSINISSLSPGIYLLQLTNSYGASVAIFRFSVVR